MATPSLSTDRPSTTVPLALLVASETNPRTSFPDDYINELAESIKQHGVIQPLLVRPLGNGSKGKFEIVAGECRYRAAKLAKLTDVPVLVRPLKDLQARELQLIENAKRRDLHPMEEARGYRQLLELRDGEGKDAKPLHTPETLAKALGKSASWIYTRAKLLDLIDVWQKEFLEHGERFTPGHAILVARLTPAHQAKTHKDVWKPDYIKNYPSVRELEQVIVERIVRSLDKAPFKSDDVFSLYNTSAAGQKMTLADAQNAAVAINPYSREGKLPVCGTCPSRIGTNPALYPGCKAFDHNTCTNGDCYETKAMMFLHRKANELAAKTPDLVVVSRDYALDTEAKKAFPNAIPAMSFREVKPNAKGAKQALVVDGNDRGKTIHIVPSTKEQAKADRGGVDVEKREENLDADIARAIRLETINELSKVITMDEDLKRDLAVFALEEGLDMNERKKFFGEAMDDCYSREMIAQVVKPFTAKQILGAIAVGIYGRLALSSWDEGHARLAAVAKARGVDLKAVEKKVRATPEFAKRLANLADLKKKQPKAKAKKAAKKR